MDDVARSTCDARQVVKIPQEQVWYSLNVQERSNLHPQATHQKSQKISRSFKPTETTLYPLPRRSPRAKHTLSLSQHVHKHPRARPRSPTDHLADQASSHPHGYPTRFYPPTCLAPHSLTASAKPKKKKSLSIRTSALAPAKVLAKHGRGLPRTRRSVDRGVALGR